MKDPNQPRFMDQPVTWEHATGIMVAWTLALIWAMDGKWLWAAGSGAVFLTGWALEYVKFRRTTLRRWEEEETQTDG